jgi:hypothetical protein
LFQEVLTGTRLNRLYPIPRWVLGFAAAIPYYLVKMDANFTCAFAAIKINRGKQDNYFPKFYDASIRFFIETCYALFLPVFPARLASSQPLKSRFLFNIRFWEKQAGYRANNDHNQMTVNAQHIFMLIKVVFSKSSRICFDHLSQFW